MSTSPRPIEVPLPDGRRLRGLEWGAHSAPPALCFHGWQDNAESFRTLAPLLLKGHDRIVALDFAGHGWSDPLASGADYTFFQYVQDCADAVDQMELEGPQKFIGHSLGAAVLLLTASAFPEKFESLVAIDALGPLSEESIHAPKRLRKSIDARNALIEKTAPTYKNIDVIVQKRIPFGPPSADQVRPIIERNFIEENGRWSWRLDPRVKLPSLVRMTEEQILTFLQGVECPVLGLRATDGWPAPVEVLNARKKAIAGLKYQELKGPHHLHIQNPVAAASAILDFWTA